MTEKPLDFLADAYSRLPLGVVCIGHDQRILWVNWAWAQLIDSSRDDLIGKLISDVMDVGALQAPITKILGGDEQSTEVVLDEPFATHNDLETPFVAYLFPLLWEHDQEMACGCLFLNVEKLPSIALATSERNEVHVHHRAGEQAVRMQRVTAALSESETSSQISDVLLGEGRAFAAAEHSLVALLGEDARQIETIRSVGKDEMSSYVPMSATDAQKLSLLEPICTGETIICDTPKALLETFPTFAPELIASGTMAIVVMPLETEGRTLGTWILSWAKAHAVEEGELIILLTLASQGAQALERAMRFEREQSISASLQRTLLPDVLREVNGATTATRYLPSSPDVEIGGDWYDVIRLPENRVGLVVGDVGGHNMDAAATMGGLRNTVRSYAFECHGAGNMMSATNRLICALEPGVLATCCYAELNLEDGIASVANAGHPPPLVIPSDGRPYFMPIASDPLLGTNGDVAYEQSTVFLLPGDTIVFYTDGLIETREKNIEQGMLRLEQTATFLTNQTPETIADKLLLYCQGNEREDDVALLVVRFDPPRVSTAPAGVRSVRRHLPSNPSSAGLARRFTCDVMKDWGAHELTDTASLCVSELVTNALIHTATDIELTVRLSEERLRVEVFDSSDRMPIERNLDEDATSGRGLFIVQTVADEWGVEPAGSGKAVWFSLAR